eukprot:scaffold190_cov171-Amphora_coffeaeformis.AAC.32
MSLNWSTICFFSQIMTEARLLVRQKIFVSREIEEERLNHSAGCAIKKKGTQRLTPAEARNSCSRRDEVKRDYDTMHYYGTIVRLCVNV